MWLSVRADRHFLPVAQCFCPHGGARSISTTYLLLQLPVGILCFLLGTSWNIHLEVFTSVTLLPECRRQHSDHDWCTCRSDSNRIRTLGMRIHRPWRIPRHRKHSWWKYLVRDCVVLLACRTQPPGCVHAHVPRHRVGDTESAFTNAYLATHRLALSRTRLNGVHIVRQQLAYTFVRVNQGQ